MSATFNVLHFRFAETQVKNLLASTLLIYQTP